MKNFLLVIIGVVLSLAGAFNAMADPITFSGTSDNLAASVTFDTSGTNLIVTLTNTSTADVFVPVDVLTGVFFSGPSFTPVSAFLNSGSTVFFGSSNGGNVGGEWAYASGLSGVPGSANSGISSSGLGLFGGPNFGGSNLQDPTAVDGLQYGITSAGDNTATGNAPVTGTNALIQNSVVFTLTGLPTNFNPADDITNVSFQYGTDLSEPNVTPTPEPGTLILLGSGLASIGLWGRRKLKAKI